MSEDRVNLLQQQVVNLGSIVERMDQKVDGIAQTLSSLARIEERQVITNEKLMSGANIMSQHDVRIRHIEQAMPIDLHKRLGDIEQNMPGLKEARLWVIAGGLGIIAMVGTAVYQLVLK